MDSATPEQVNLALFKKAGWGTGWRDGSAIKGEAHNQTYKKAGWVSHEGQASKLCFSMVFASAPASSFYLGFLPT